MEKPPLRPKKRDPGGDDIDDDMQLFSPSTETITIKGTLFYHDSVRAWNTLRLKKEILNKFPNLKNKEQKGIYLMRLPTSFKALAKEFELLKKTKALPIMVFLGQEKKTD